MGMDYRYAGSAGYTRFENELCEIAKLLGGVESETLKEQREKVKEDFWDNMFGYMSRETPENVRFIFMYDTPEIVVKWFNNIYGDYTANETKEVFDFIFHEECLEEIKEISPQICLELEQCVENGTGWYVY